MSTLETTLKASNISCDGWKDSTITAIDGTYISSATIANTAISSNYYQVIPQEPNEADIFKQITALLGIKITNVSIKDGKVVLYGRRNKKKYIIEINNRMVIVRDEKGNAVSEIFLASDYASGGTITVTPNIDPVWVYPYPGTTSPNTTPNIWYTTDSSGTCSTINTNITGKTHV